MSEQTRECSHETASKFLVRQGSEGHYTGYLACEGCLTEADFRLYPGWKERIQKREQKAEQLRVPMPWRP